MADENNDSTPTLDLDALLPVALDSAGPTPVEDAAGAAETEGGQETPAVHAVAEATDLPDEHVVAQGLVPCDAARPSGRPPRSPRDMV